MDFPGKNTGVGRHFSPGDIPNPGVKSKSPAWQEDSIHYVFIYIFVVIYKSIKSSL